MAKFSFTRQINSPRDQVFAVFSDFDEMAQRIDSITNVQVLTPGPVGVGTRFKETREIFGKEATEEMEVTAFDAGQLYVVEADSHGTHYRSEFRFEPEGAATRVDVEFQATPRSWPAKLMAPLGWIMMKSTMKIFERDVDDLKQVVESTQ